MPTLSITRPTANTLITASGFASRYTEIETVVNALDGDNFADDAITAAKLNSDVVRTNYGLVQHTDGSLYVDVSDTNPALELSDGGLRVKVDDSTIERASGGLQVKDGGISSAKLASDVITGAKIADDAVDSEHIIDGAVDPGHLAASCVQTAKIADDNVTEDKLADYAESFSTNGYVKLTGGLIMQWGEATGSGATAITFPTAFTTSCLQVIVCSGASGSYSNNETAYSISTTGFSCNISGAGTIRYLAIGY